MASLSISGRDLEPIGTEVLFENEHIRVWKVDLPPRGIQPLHEHLHPYLVIPISDGKSIMRWEDGREQHLTDVPGDIRYRDASGGPHELHNLENEKRTHSILVEIKAATLTT